MGGTSTTDTGSGLSNLTGSNQMLPFFFMKPTPIVTVITATLICIGAALLLGAKETRKPWPKPAPPPPPSPIYHPSSERAQTEAEIAQLAGTRYQHIELEIERALQGRSSQQREAVFTFLLPELIQVEPKRVVAMFDRQKPGEARDTLRSEMARQWTVRDFDAAVTWMKSLDEHERRASAATAVDSIAPYAPAVAKRLAREFDLRGPKRATRD